MKRHLDIVIFALLVLLFVGWPQLDLAVSGWFYDSLAGQWPREDAPFYVAVYGVFRYIPYLIVPVLLIGTGLTFWRSGLPASQRRVWVFLLVSLLAGPGILVHSVFKEGFERPRPKQVQEFGGKSGFTPAFEVSDSCERKCRSFVSGHSAMAFWLMVFAWWTRRQVWLWLGIGLGALVSYVRIAQGGHFLSDTLFAGFICYFFYRLLSWWLLGHSRISPDPAEPKA
nr:phosphatase PAP2 family protein [Oceanobacter mangrovi]